MIIMQNRILFLILTIHLFT